MKGRLLAAIVLVAAHLGVVAWHGAAHTQVGPALPGWQTALLALVQSVLPGLALVMLWKGAARHGALLLGAAMMASLLADLVMHYTGTDAHAIAQVAGGGWARTLRVTALLGILVETAGLWLAGWLLRAAPPTAEGANRAARRRVQR